MANREMRSSLKRWISAVAWFLRACGRGLWLALRVWMGWGPRVDVEVEPRSTFAFGRGFSRVVSVLFARVGPVGVCVRARVGVARRWKSACSYDVTCADFENSLYALGQSERS